MLPAQEHVDGCQHAVETSLNHDTWVHCGHFWHSTFGTGALTASRHMLQPNSQGREFGQHAPILNGLDPAKVYQCCCDLCRVGHAHGIYFPAHEEIRPVCAFSIVECGDTPTA